jgi:hypothetical protein
MLEVPRVQLIHGLARTKTTTDLDADDAPTLYPCFIACGSATAVAN